MTAATFRAVAEGQHGYRLTTPDGAELADYLEALSALGRGDARLELDHADTLDAVTDWDHAWRVDRHAFVTLSVPDVFAPDAYLECDADGSLLPDAEADLTAALARQGWEPVGTSGQQGGGYVMHSSEYLGGGLARDVLSTPGVYLFTEARGQYPDSVTEEEAADLDASPIGWILLRQVTNTEA